MTPRLSKEMLQRLNQNQPPLMQDQIKGAREVVGADQLHFPSLSCTNIEEDRHKKFGYMLL